ncbi:MAG: amino acid adenylation domain-containing protein, partial [Acidobacteria bacterium]
MPRTPIGSSPRSPERLVGLLVDPGPHVLPGMLGILEAGAGFVPLDPRHPEERLAFALADCGVRVLVTEAAYRPAAERLRQRVAGLEHVVDLDALFADGPGPDGAGDAGDQPAAVDPDQLAYVIFTSGSTGQPKGVGISHRNLAPMLAWGLAYFRLGAHSRVLQTLSPWFDFGVFEQLTTALAGGTLYVLPAAERGDPLRAAAAVAAEGLNTVHATPTYVREMARAGADLSGVEILHLGGEALSPEQIAELWAAFGERTVIYNGYGPTETTINTTIFNLGSRAEPRLGNRASVPIGRPSADHRVYVLDRHGRPLPQGVPGELYVGGPLVCRGYLGRPALTAERFLPDPFGEHPGGRLYRTGDRVRFDAGGELIFLGRLDHQVKLRGLRIELGEIEALLRRHPRVAEAVVQVRSLNGDAQLVAWLTSRDGEGVADGELRSFLAEQLPAYMVPSAFVHLPQMPTSSTGKIDLRALPEPRLERTGAGDGKAAASPREEAIARLWAETLRCERVGRHDDFFALGGHSLLAAHLVARLRQETGLEIPLRKLFEAPTVAAMAAEIERLEEAAEAPVPPLEPVPRDDAAGMPLSFAQERLWILDRLEPGTTAYNMPAALRLRGELDLPSLGRAITALAGRHQSLRTTFASRAGRPRQFVRPPAPVALPAVDLRPLPAARRQRVAAGLIDGFVRPFDLARGPLIRFRLVRLDDGEHLLLFDVHHIVCDGWSYGLLTRELAALYNAFRAGRPSPLRPLPVQYPDYAAWQRRFVSGARRQRQLDYWHRQLGDSPARLELPADRPRAAIHRFRGGQRQLRLPAALGTRLEALGQQHGMTLFMVMLAALKVLLSRLAGQDDVAVGTPIANRDRAAVLELIGILLNTLVLRTDVGGGPTFVELAERVQRVALDAYAHQDVPFEHLLDVLQPERDLSRTPLFQVFFNMLNLPPVELDLSGLAVEPLSAPEQPAKFDLTIYAKHDDDALQLTATYNADLFDAERIDELLAQYAGLLEQVVADPLRPIADYDLRTAGAERRLPDPRRPLPPAPPQPPV